MIAGTGDVDGKLQSSRAQADQLIVHNLFTDDFMSNMK